MPEQIFSSTDEQEKLHLPEDTEKKALNFQFAFKQGTTHYP